MSPSNSPLNTILSLENELKHTAHDSHRQSELLTTIIAYYVFADPPKALQRLKKQAPLLDNEHPTAQLQYYIHLGATHNQLYHFEAAILHFEQANELAQEIPTYITLRIELYIEFAAALLNVQDKLKSQHFLELAKTLLASTGAELNLLRARFYVRQAFLMLHIKDIEKATNLMLEAEKLLHEAPQLTIRDNNTQTTLYSALGTVYKDAEDYLKASVNYKRAVDICENAGMMSRISYHYLNLGNALMTLGKYDEAATYFEKALLINEDSSQSSRMNIRANLGYMSKLSGNLDAAMEQFSVLEAEYHALETPDATVNIAKIYHWMGQVYLLQDNKQGAVYYLSDAFREAKRSEQYDVLAEVSQDIASYYANSQDYKSAYEYLDMHATFKAQYIEEKNRNRIQDLELKFEIVRKNRESEHLRAETARLQLKALRAQMNPHFLFNAMNAIQQLIDENVEMASTILAKFAKLLRRILDYSDVDRITLEQEIEFLRDYLTINTSLRFGDSMTFDIKLATDLDDDLILVPAMIVQPYLENAIEHGLKPRRGGHLSLHFFAENDNILTCVIEDNGVGRDLKRMQNEANDTHFSHAPRGTSITQQRIELLETGAVHYTDLTDSEQKPTGTRVTIRLPLEYV